MGAGRRTGASNHADLRALQAVAGEITADRSCAVRAALRRVGALRPAAAESRAVVSALSSDDHGCGPENFVANDIALSDDGDDLTDLVSRVGRRYRDGIVLQRIEHLSEGFEAHDIHGCQLAKKLIAHQFDTAQQRLGAAAIDMLSSGLDGAIEIVEHVEHLDKDHALPTFDIARHFPSNAGPRLLEFVGRPPVFDEDSLQLFPRLHQLLFEVFAAVWFGLGRGLGRLGFRRLLFTCPPAPVDNAHFRIV